MDRSELKRMEGLETSYWWFIGRRELVLSFLRGYTIADNYSMLDIGCGTGIFLKEASKYMKYTAGLDKSDHALNLCRQKGIKEIYRGDAANIPFKARTFDFVTALDVFEHIEDDEGVLRECFRVLKNKGKLLLSVPAFNFLWSKHDIILQHKRRCNISELREKMELAGFRINRMSYCLFFLFLPIFIFRLLERILVKFAAAKTTPPPVPDYINHFLLSILRIENFLINIGVNFPFGVSIICIARK